MKKFEYKVLKVDISGGFFSLVGKVDEIKLNAHLNELGAKGWELINVMDTNMSQGQ